MWHVGSDRCSHNVSRVKFKQWEGDIANVDYINQNGPQKMFVVKQQLSPVGQLTIEVSKQIPSGSAAILKCW